MHHQWRVLIFDEVMTGFRVCAGRGAGDLRSQPDLTALGKVIGGGLPWALSVDAPKSWTSFRPRPGLSGGNFVGKSAGDGRGPGATARAGADRRLEITGGTGRGIRARGVPSGYEDRLTFHRIGSMFCLFFAPGPIVDLASARRSDLGRSRDSFMVAWNAASISRHRNSKPVLFLLAHTAEDLERTAAVIAKCWRPTKELVFTRESA